MAQRDGRERRQRLTHHNVAGVDAREELVSLNEARPDATRKGLDVRVERIVVLGDTSWKRLQGFKFSFVSGRARETKGKTNLEEP